MDSGIEQVVTAIESYFEDMSDSDDTPFGTNAQFDTTRTVEGPFGFATMEIRPDADPEHYFDRAPGIPAPTEPVIRVTIERIR